MFVKTNSYKIDLSHIQVIYLALEENLHSLEKSAEKTSTKRKLGTPWEINGVYCNLAELTDFIHYPYYEDLSSINFIDKSNRLKINVLYN